VELPPYRDLWRSKPAALAADLRDQDRSAMRGIPPMRSNQELLAFYLDGFRNKWNGCDRHTFNMMEDRLLGCGLIPYERGLCHLPVATRISDIAEIFEIGETYQHGNATLRYVMGVLIDVDVVFVCTSQHRSFRDAVDPITYLRPSEIMRYKTIKKLPRRN